MQFILVALRSASTEGSLLNSTRRLADLVQAVKVALSQRIEFQLQAPMRRADKF